MQLVTRATSIAAVTPLFIFMLMEIAVAVEVTDGGTPALPSASSVESPAQDSLIPDPRVPDPSIPDPLIPDPSIPTLPSSGAAKATPQPPSPSCFILGSRSFSIPFSVDAAGAQPVEVHLFVSSGPQDEWRLLDRKSPNVPKKQFQFEADRDGEFWFATRTVDSLGQLHPEGPIESQLKVYVDTTKPEVEFHADADADGRLEVKVSVQDATQVKETVLRYVTDQVGQWVNVDLHATSSDGRLQFQPDHDWNQLSIQVVASDTPGNQCVVNQLLRRPRMADSGSRQYAQVDGAKSPALSPSGQPMVDNRAFPQSSALNPVIKLDRVRTPAEMHVATADGAVQSKPTQRMVAYGRRGIARPPKPSPATTSGVTSPPPANFPSSPPYAAAPVAAPPAQPFAVPAPSQPVAVLPGSSVPSAIPAPPTSATAPGLGMAGPGMAGPGMAPSTGMTAPPQAPASDTSTANTTPNETRTSKSLFDVLFRTNAAASSSAGVTSGPSNALAPPASGIPSPTSSASPFSFTPPNVRASQVQSRLAGSVNTPLPPPATPEQISNGFGLNSPGQVQPESIPLPTQPAPHGDAAANSLSVGPQPETIPVPSNGQPDPEAAPRPRTPAEALRPITEPSQVNEFAREDVPAPQGESDPAYQSLRADPGATQPPGPQDAVADMMQRSPVRYSDSERFSLEYELEAVGAQGVDAVELYGSVDGGRTWDLWGQDPDRESPFDIEVKEVGVFAFRIVVVGRNGLASPRPIQGETPDIVVVVDNTRPVVRITGAQYGEGDRIGALVIQYQCEDSHLRERPISLSFSDRLDGPWTTIAAGLRNEGQYVWNADPHLPRQFYLRVDAIDEAGNTSSYVLDQPIDAQGLAPRARIRGFQTLSGGERPAPVEGQTAKGSPSLLK